MADTSEMSGRVLSSRMAEASKVRGLVSGGASTTEKETATATNALVEEDPLDDGGDEDGGNFDEDEDEPEDPDDNDPLEPVAGQVRLCMSLFEGCTPTIFFDYPKELNIPRHQYFAVQKLSSRKLIYFSKWERNCVKNAFARAGFDRTDKQSSAWNAYWGKHPSHKDISEMNRFQKVNHFPGSWCIGRKDRLARTILKFRRRLGNEAYHFHPDVYHLPSERRMLDLKIKSEKSVWIIKPAASSCGRGIRLIHKDNLNTVGANRKAVVQRYIDKPHLINATKYDLRLYVVMTSVDPLRCYLFEHGLVRFSTSKYSMSAKSLKSRYTHLTNYSINKKSKNFVSNEGGLQEDGTGSKWSLHALWRHMRNKMGMSEAAIDKVKDDIKDVVAKTLIAAEADIAPAMAKCTRKRGLCYELYGFDIMLDAALKPWLIEVNISPSLMGSSPLDREIKGTLMADIFHLVGFVPYDGKQIARDEKKERANKLRGINDGRSKALLSRRQDAWRRNPSPDSIDLAELTPEDWDVIYESEDELARSGHFERIFPSADRSPRLLPLFVSQRFNDVLLARVALDTIGGMRTREARRLFQHSPLGAPLPPEVRYSTSGGGAGAGSNPSSGNGTPSDPKAQLHASNSNSGSSAGTTESATSLSSENGGPEEQKQHAKRMPATTGAAGGGSSGVRPSRGGVTAAGLLPSRPLGGAPSGAVGQTPPGAPSRTGSGGDQLHASGGRSRSGGSGSGSGGGGARASSNESGQGENGENHILPRRNLSHQIPTSPEGLIPGGGEGYRNHVSKIRTGGTSGVRAGMIDNMVQSAPMGYRGVTNESPRQRISVDTQRATLGRPQQVRRGRAKSDDGGNNARHPSGSGATRQQQQQVSSGGSRNNVIGVTVSINGVGASERIHDGYVSTGRPSTPQQRQRFRQQEQRQNQRQPPGTFGPKLTASSNEFTFDFQGLVPERKNANGYAQTTSSPPQQQQQVKLGKGPMDEIEGRDYVPSSGGSNRRTAARPNSAGASRGRNGGISYGLQGSEGTGRGTGRGALAVPASVLITQQQQKQRQQQQQQKSFAQHRPTTPNSSRRSGGNGNNGGTVGSGGRDGTSGEHVGTFFSGELSPRKLGQRGGSQHVFQAQSSINAKTEHDLRQSLNRSGIADSRSSHEHEQSRIYDSNVSFPVRHQRRQFLEKQLIEQSQHDNLFQAMSSPSSPSHAAVTREHIQKQRQPDAVSDVLPAFAAQVNNETIFDNDGRFDSLSVEEARHKTDSSSVHQALLEKTNKQKVPQYVLPLNSPTVHEMALLQYSAKMEKQQQQQQYALDADALSKKVSCVV